MSIQDELKTELKTLGADFVHFADISHLLAEQNKGYSTAILIGNTLSPDFIQEVTNKPDYLEEMIRINKLKDDEFHVKEAETDKMADFVASYLISKDYSAYSQSESNLYTTGFYDEKIKNTPLPHKTIAGLAGIGWIGKNSLLVTAEFGSAICICSVLTNAPLKTVRHTPANPLCGDCKICKDVCKTNAIEGEKWTIGTSRDTLIDVNKCNMCLKCLALCPWTQKYMKKNIVK